MSAGIPETRQDQQACFEAGITPAPELVVVVPVFNERENVTKVVEALDKALSAVSWEVIFIDDDSEDGTAAVVHELASRDGRVRLLHRVGRRGLSSACIEGIMASTARYCAVMDGDLQHDQRLLPEMLEVLRKGESEIVIGSRYMQGGGTGDWDSRRVGISRLASRMSKLVLHATLTDPMSGFFMVTREAFLERVHRLSGIGFKILLDLFASSEKPLEYRELPYEFRPRQAGKSKLDSRVGWEYFMLLADKLIGHVVPVRFIAFSLVGGIGVGVHMAVLWVLFNGLKMDFPLAQTGATLVAMVGNFTMNNLLTYRDRRLHGLGWWKGLLTFTVACSVGALANIGISSYLYAQQGVGWVLSAVAGILLGAVWNYAVTSVYTWNKPKVN